MQPGLSAADVASVSIDVDWMSAEWIPKTNKNTTQDSKTSINGIILTCRNPPHRHHPRLIVVVVSSQNRSAQYANTVARVTMRLQRLLYFHVRFQLLSQEHTHTQRQTLTQAKAHTLPRSYRKVRLYGNRTETHTHTLFTRSLCWQTDKLIPSSQ